MSDSRSPHDGIWLVMPDGSVRDVGMWQAGSAGAPRIGEALIVEGLAYRIRDVLWTIGSTGPSGLTVVLAPDERDDA